MNAVERINLFSGMIPQEAPFHIPETAPPEDWPQRGEIEFKGVEFSYRKGLDPVLRDLSLKVESGTKVGIVGRTGAGKSSVLVILLRIAELSGGSILIDGVDISKIGLHDLRSKVGIIPQDPTIFTGTIRSNLDPFHEYSNEEVWEALSQAQLVETIEKDGGLEAEVKEDGQNYSLGQRQLLCLARTLLRKPKILLMDEATASVDMENDVLIQETVRKRFGQSTVLTIAHRLHTVVDSDVIMVLEKGTLAEMAKPEVLVSKEKSHFKSLIEATGAASSQHLMNFILHGKNEGRSTFDLVDLDRIRKKDNRKNNNNNNNNDDDNKRLVKEPSYADILLQFDQSTFPLVSRGAKPKKDNK